MFRKEEAMNKIHTDMPGDVILIHPDQKRIVSNILNASLGEMKKIISKQKRLVVSIFGGSVPANLELQFCCRNNYRKLESKIL